MGNMIGKTIFFGIFMVLFVASAVAQWPLYIVIPLSILLYAVSSSGYKEPFCFMILFARLIVAGLIGLNTFFFFYHKNFHIWYLFTVAFICFHLYQYEYHS
jgi:hypothetical protein